MTGNGPKTLADLAARLNSRARAARRLPALILMTDPERLPDPLAAAGALPRRSTVILRHYGDPARAELALRLALLCRARGLKLLVAADPALAARVGADGVHLPEGLAHRARAVRLKAGWLVTAAAHSYPALVRAARAGADAALLGPVFPTASRPEGAPLGPLRFAALVERAPLPVYALGGITARSGRLLAGTGAVGIAAIGALLPAVGLPPPPKLPPSRPVLRSSGAAAAKGGSPLPAFEASAE